MKTSVSSYSFNGLTSTGKMTYQDCIKKTQELGIEGFEFAGLPKSDDPEACAKELGEACKSAGLAITNYTVGADLLNGMGVHADEEVSRLKKHVDIACALGAKGMRHDLLWSVKNREWRGFNEILDMLVPKVRELTQYAESKGIRTMVENHGYFAQDSDRMERLVNKVAHTNFGLLVDIGNFLCVDENPILAVSRVAPYAFHVHAKDFHIKSGSEPHPGQGFFGTRGGNHLRGAIVGHGNVPVKQCLDIIKSAGYNGYISIEFEGMEDPIIGIKVGHENLKRYIL